MTLLARGDLSRGVTIDDCTLHLRPHKAAQSEAFIVTLDVYRRMGVVDPASVLSDQAARHPVAEDTSGGVQ